MAKKFKSDRSHTRRRPARVRLVLEELENRCVLAANLAPELFVNDTLDVARDLGSLTSVLHTTVDEALGNSPVGTADVDWYRFTLDEAADVTLTSRGTASVLSLYQDLPFDFVDRYTQQGVRQLAQQTTTDANGVTTLERHLSAGTYYVAISGAGNEYFNPFVAASGYSGQVGEYHFEIDAHNLAIDPADGPRVLESNPAAGAELSQSPLVLRFSFSTALSPDLIFPGDNVRILYNAQGTFGDGNDQEVFIDQANFSTVANELQILPSAPLAPGCYQVLLAGNLDTNFSVLMDPNGVAIGTDADHPWGQDYVLTFQVTGNEGNTDLVSDDTMATAHELGDVTSAGLVQRSGAIGDDASDPIPYNPSDVDLYHFTITGPGRYAFVAEVFARRIGSPLNSGVSLFRLDPSDGQLHLVAGNDDTQNATSASDGKSLPLLSDSALFAGLTAGDYYIAVSSRKNVPDPARGFLPGENGIFDPNVSQSGSTGASYGPYLLNLYVVADDTAPHVVSVTPSTDSVLTTPPTQIFVQFSEAVNLQQMAFGAFQATSHGALDSVYLEDANGTRYSPRLIDYDHATNRATFQLLDGLPNGSYTLHLSGALGLSDGAGNPLIGNDASDDYVVRFDVNGPARGSVGDPTAWVAGASAEQDLGVLFPHELQSGVTISRGGGTATGSTDTYRFEVLQVQSYFFFLTNTGTVSGLTLTLRTVDGAVVPTASQPGGGKLGLLEAGVYELEVGWSAGAAAQVGYKVRVTLGGSGENPPPLTVGPAPAIRVRLAGSPPSNNDPPPQVIILGVPPDDRVPIPPLSGTQTGTPVTSDVKSNSDLTKSSVANPLSLFSALGDGFVGSIVANRANGLATPDRVVIQTATSPTVAPASPDEGVRLTALELGNQEALALVGMIHWFATGPQQVGQVWSLAQERLLEAFFCSSVLPGALVAPDALEDGPMSRSAETQIPELSVENGCGALLALCLAVGLTLPAPRPVKSRRKKSIKLSRRRT